MGFNLVIIGIGFYVVGVLVVIVKNVSDGFWYLQDLNVGKLENYFFFFVVVMFVNFFFFVFFVRKYKYVEFLNIVIV